MKFEKKYIAGKFPFIVGVVILLCIAVIVKLILTMTVNKEEPLEYKKKYVDGKITEAKAMRGNILSDDGKLLSSTLPEYTMGYDFLAGVEDLNMKMKEKNYEKFRKDSLLRDSLITWRDSVFVSKVDTLCKEVIRLCPELAPAEALKAHMLEGVKSHKRYYDLFKGHVFDYLAYLELDKMFKEIFYFPKVKGKKQEKYTYSLAKTERVYRHHPFDSLANKTLGVVNADIKKDSAESGLELAFDSILRGHPGLRHKKHIRSYDVDLNVEDAINGYDLKSTINVTYQDICETALREKVQEVEAEFGVCILMDVKTGDVKALVNLKRGADGVYRETANNAMEALMEPGSTFKTASIMVALDDGRLSMDETVDTSKGYKDYGPAKMKDDGGRGHGICDVKAGVKYSSNVAVSTFIDRHYHNDPEVFIEGLKRIGIGAPLHLPFKGAKEPRIYGPKENKYWSKVVSLPWMSIGYNTQIPPISTVTFYNAIANGGKMVKPRFATAITQNGEVIEELPVEVIREHICKESTLKNIHEILKEVVNGVGGTGKRVKSKYFYISGKTGTAQVADEKGGYQNGRKFVSFCGYYPSDNPQFTCLVAIKTAFAPVSGGATAGVVFKKIAEQIYAKHLSTNLNLAVDTINPKMPAVKPGNINAAQNVLQMLGIKTARNVVKSIWGQATAENGVVNIKESENDLNKIPDLKGMGARDAVYALHLRGVKVKISGFGQVKEQDIPPGATVKKGQTVNLRLG